MEADQPVPPQSLEQYIQWAGQAINCAFDDEKIASLYDTNVASIYNAVNAHEFFTAFPSQAAEWQAIYAKNTSAELFMDRGVPSLLTKTFTSVVEKTFRLNILWNKDFPGRPKRGWLDHNTLFEQMNDLVRGTLVCRFIDGPQYVAERIVAHAKACKLKVKHYSQERDDGYYAYHVYISFPVAVLDLNWNKKQIFADVEIQITTQLQEVLRSLTHKFYEANRLMPNDDRGKWKWDFSSNRFKVGYLSHSLHLLESIILDARKSMSENRATGWEAKE